MNVGILTYPMLFQNEGGLQVQVLETLKYLNQIGIRAGLVDVTRQNLADFDVIHVFAAIHGNENLVEQAKNKGCIVILSPLINPSLVPPSTSSLHAVRILSRAINRLSKWTVTTNYVTVKKALTGADHLVALSNSERSILTKVYGVNKSTVSVVPNGVSPHFFEANELLFQAEYKISSPFVFCPGQISPWKNQKTLVEAMAGTDIEVVLAGPVHEHNKQYLADCLNVSHAKVTYIGNLDRTSSAFSGCYSAASAVVLPSKGESGPLVALESLAAGTPAIITNKNGLDLIPDGECLTTIDPFDRQSIRSAVQRVLQSRPSRERCKSIVTDFSWLIVAQDIAAIYSAEIRKRHP